MESKRTAIIGATTKTDRYAYKAAERLTQKGHEIVLLGIREGKVLDHDILLLQNEEPIPEIDTLTLYINPHNQKQWYKYLLSLKPKRIIFNPGTENPELIELAQGQNIETVTGCTLVMLSLGHF